jgi:hypothetical protein
MLGWAVGFSLAALVAGVFAFGFLETSLANTAMDVFWGCIALFGASLLFAVVGGKYAAPLASSGRAFARMAFVACAALLGYVWYDRNWAGETSVPFGDDQFAEQGAAVIEEPTPVAEPTIGAVDSVPVTEVEGVEDTEPGSN